MAIEIPGISVLISGDFSKLQSDLKQARGVIKSQATGISDDLNNALSPRQIQSSVNQLVANLSKIDRAAGLTSDSFKGVGVELTDLRMKLGVSERSFASLQSRMLERKASDQAERALQSIARQAGLSRLEVAKLQAQMGNWSGALKTMTSRLTDGAKAMLSWQGALALAAGATGLGYMVKQSLEAADAIGKVSARVGLTTDALQELRYAAELSGVQTSALDMAMQRFSRRVGEAVNGTGELKDTLKQYHIAVTDANGRTRDNADILGDLADAIKNAKSEQEQLRIAFKAFDSEGAALVEMLRNGSVSLEDMRTEAHRLGLVIDEDLIQESTKANDAVTKLESTLRTNLTSTLAELAPTITRFSDGLTSLVTVDLDDIEAQTEAWAALNEKLDDAIAILDESESPKRTQFWKDRVEVYREQAAVLRETGEIISESEAETNLLSRAAEASRKNFEALKGITSDVKTDLTESVVEFGKLLDLAVRLGTEGSEDIGGQVSDNDGSGSSNYWERTQKSLEEYAAARQEELSQSSADWLEHLSTISTASEDAADKIADAFESSADRQEQALETVTRTAQSMYQSTFGNGMSSTGGEGTGEGGWYLTPENTIFAPLVNHLTIARQEALAAYKAEVEAENTWWQKIAAERAAAAETAAAAAEELRQQWAEVLPSYQSLYESMVDADIPSASEIAAGFNSALSSVEAATEFIEDLTVYVQYLQGIQSGYESLSTGITSYLQNREREDWTLSDWTQEYTRLQAEQAALDASSETYWEDSLAIYEDMFDVLKSIDTLTAEANADQEALLTSLAGISGLTSDAIASLQVSSLAPTQSADYYTSQYEELFNAAALAIATDAEDASDLVSEFISFVQSSYLPFMSSYGGDYATIYASTLQDLEELGAGADYAATGVIDTIDEVIAALGLMGTTLEDLIGSGGSITDTSAALATLGVNLDDLSGTEGIPSVTSATSALSSALDDSDSSFTGVVAALEELAAKSDANLSNIADSLTAVVQGLADAIESISTSSGTEVTIETPTTKKYAENDWTWTTVSGPYGYWSTSHMEDSDYIYSSSDGMDPNEHPAYWYYYAARGGMTNRPTMIAEDYEWEAAIPLNPVRNAQFWDAMGIKNDVESSVVNAVSVALQSAPINSNDEVIAALGLMGKTLEDLIGSGGSITDTPAALTALEIDFDDLSGSKIAGVVDSTSDLSSALDDSDSSFTGVVAALEELAAKSDANLSNIADSLTAVVQGLADAIDSIGQSSGTTVTITTPTTKEYTENDWYWTSASGGAMGYWLTSHMPYEERVIGTESQMPTYWYTYTAGYGGYTNAPTLAGEAGPEWIVPIDKPKNNSFLNDIGVADQVRSAVAEGITVAIQGLSINAGGGEQTINLNVDGKTLASVITNQLAYNRDLQKATARAARI